MKHPINEWQDLSLRKDVENISRELRKKKNYEKTLLLEILIATITLLFDKFFDLFNNCEMMKKIVYGILAFAALAILIYVLSGLLKEYFEVKSIIKKSIVAIKPYVDSFDNNVCYYALTACNFYEDLLQISTGLSGNETNAVKEKENFFYIETNYYINKCIAEINKMENVIENVFTDNAEDVIYYSKIHFSRLKNIVDLMLEIRKHLYTMNKVKSFSETKTISEKYDEVMRNVVLRTNRLNLFNDKLLWITKNN